MIPDIWILMAYIGIIHIDMHIKGQLWRILGVTLRLLNSIIYGIRLKFFVTQIKEVLHKL